LPQTKAKEGHSCNAFAACCWLSKQFLLNYRCFLSPSRLPNIASQEYRLPNIASQEYRLANIGSQEYRLANIASQEYRLANIASQEYRLANIGSQEKDYWQQTFLFCLRMPLLFIA